MARSSPIPDRDKCVEAAHVCACLNFRKASRVVTQLFDDVLQPTGLRSTQLVLLIATYILDSPTVARLSRELVMDRSTLTRNLVPLARQRLVRITAGTDRRTRVVALTPRGRARLAFALPHWERAQQRFVQQLGAERWRELLAHLTATVASLKASSPHQ